VQANVLALVAAFAFALGNVLQQKGTLEAPAGADDPHFLVQILRRPVWLAGGGLQMCGWVLQAVALGTGSLIVVQSLTTMSLVIALPLGARLTGQEVSRRVWLGAAAMVVGIVLFLSVGAPTGGTASPPASAWWSAGLTAAVLIMVLRRFGRHRQGATQALLLGSAAGVAFALQGSVTKVFVTVVGHGLDAILTSWTIYVLIASALVGFVLQQSAFKSGVLAPAMASSNAVTLFGSVAFGATVFGESLSSGGARLAPALVGLGVALVGIVLLAGARPPQASEGMPRFDQIPTDAEEARLDRGDGTVPRP
jgi:drug/metabolite transporter (DMT)-like permease